MNQRISILGVPWDITSTYRRGSYQSPAHIQSVFHQLDETHPFSADTPCVSWLQTSKDILNLQEKFGSIAQEIICKLNHQHSLTDDDRHNRDAINRACTQMNQWVYDESIRHINTPMMVCGGEHGVGLGYVRALSSIHSSFSILHIDSHKDCYQAYYGFDYSHASIMAHYSAIPSIDTIVQVGIRDYSPSESEFQANARASFHVFDDYAIHKRLFEGETWGSICHSIISQLSDSVFISLDVDGLMAYLCPNTGTPVPGGLSYNQLVYLLDQLVQSKHVIGAELVEVNVSSQTDWDANVGARLLFLLAGCLN